MIARKLGFWETTGQMWLVQAAVYCPVFIRRRSIPFRKGYGLYNVGNVSILHKFMICQKLILNI